MEKIMQLYIKYREIIMYVFVGGLTTVVSFVSHFFVRYFDGSVDMAVNISWLCAVTFAFFTNKSWVFKSQSKKVTQFIKEFVLFYAARLASLFVEKGFMWIFVTKLSSDEFEMKIAAQVLILILNYAFSKYVIFRKNKKNISEKN